MSGYLSIPAIYKYYREKLDQRAVSTLIPSMSTSPHVNNQPLDLQLFWKIVFLVHSSFQGSDLNNSL
jgi:hypothetical protein